MTEICKKTPYNSTKVTFGPISQTSSISAKSCSGLIEKQRFVMVCLLCKNCAETRFQPFILPLKENSKGVLSVRKGHFSLGAQTSLS